MPLSAASNSDCGKSLQFSDCWLLCNFLRAHRKIRVASSHFFLDFFVAATLVTTSVHCHLSTWNSEKTTEFYFIKKIVCGYLSAPVNPRISEHYITHEFLTSIHEHTSLSFVGWICIDQDKKKKKWFCCSHRNFTGLNPPQSFSPSEKSQSSSKISHIKKIKTWWDIYTNFPSNFWSDLS